MAVVMGTAGHIDHGKTSLVRALTNIDCDRLEEEKRRGITIELGFAHLDLPDGTRLGLVDVPGHERFVRNMVAGAAGIDFVMLVIAADEGVMPQTREHMEICSLLGIRHGLVALTKIDMVDPELLELAEDDVHQFLQGTFLEQAPLFPVSSQTLEGIDSLRAYLLEQAHLLQPQRRNDFFRLPIDRVFSMKGHGTVVTGTLLSGNPKVGDEVHIMPATLPSRIRGIQSHGHAEDMAQPGQRTSINLHALEVADIERGDVLAFPNTLIPSQRWLVRLNCLSSSPLALRQRTEIHFHHGAKELFARLYFFDRDRLEPGESALVEVRFSSPMVGVFNDHCVIRAFSPLRTVAGGSVVLPLDLGPRKLRALPTEWQEALFDLPLHSDDEENLITTQLLIAGPQGLNKAALSLCTNIVPRRLEKALASLSQQAKAICYDKESSTWLHANHLSHLLEQCLAQAALFHSREPLKPGMPKGVLFAGWSKKLPPKLTHLVLERLLKNNSLILEGDLVRLSTHKVSLASDQSQLKQALLNAHTATPMTPPNLKDVLEALKVSPKEAADVLKLLQAENLIKIKEGLYYYRPTIEELQEKICAWFQNHDDLSPADFKELTNGLSRKYIIPLLEYFDKERFTIRIGNKRQLRKK